MGMLYRSGGRFGEVPRQGYWRLFPSWSKSKILWSDDCERVRFLARSWRDPRWIATPVHGIYDPLSSLPLDSTMSQIC